MKYPSILISNVRSTTLWLAALIVVLVASQACNQAAPPAAAPAAGAAGTAAAGTDPQIASGYAPDVPATLAPVQPAPGRTSASATRAGAPGRQSGVSSSARGRGRSAGVSIVAGDTAATQISRRPEGASAEEAAQASASVAPGRAEVQDDSRTYSKDDRDVVPPKLLYSQVSTPLFRNNSRPGINTMELVISEQGDVVQVKMLTDPRRMTDMMLLSGAKTWRFDPARREGLPVRYRLEFTWESTP